MNKYSVKLESWSDEEKYYVVCVDEVIAVKNFMRNLHLPYLPEKMVVNLEELDVEMKKECHAIIDYTKFLEILPIFMPDKVMDSFMCTLEDNDVFIRFFDMGERNEMC